MRAPRRSRELSSSPCASWLPLHPVLILAANVASLRATVYQADCILLQQMQPVHSGILPGRDRRTERAPATGRPCCAGGSSTLQALRPCVKANRYCGASSLIASHSTTTLGKPVFSIAQVEPPSVVIKTPTSVPM